MSICKKCGKEFLSKECPNCKNSNNEENENQKNININFNIDTKKTMIQFSLLLLIIFIFTIALSEYKSYRDKKDIEEASKQIIKSFNLFKPR